MEKVLLLIVLHCMVILPQVRVQDLMKDPVTDLSPFSYNSYEKLFSPPEVYIMDVMLRDSSEISYDSLYRAYDTVRTVYDRVFSGIGFGLYFEKDEKGELDVWYTIDLPFGFSVNPFSFYAVLRLMRRPEYPQENYDVPEPPMIFDLSYLLGASVRIDIYKKISLQPVVRKVIRKGKSDEYNLGLQIRAGNQLGGFYADYHYALSSFDDYVSIGMVLPVSVLFLQEW
ncbi:MAG: hypothetical protein HRU80_03330 [Ignavibacteriales bacterium]|nr:MAG: hypothetical protein HRU80_03330 [Ignavibacteriales bacterium]